MDTIATPRKPHLIGSPRARRWECSCREPAVLLGLIEPDGTITIKNRERDWVIQGTVQTRCPRCGQQHASDEGQAHP
jgi:hypothetical protein